VETWFGLVLTVGHALWVGCASGDYAKKDRLTRKDVPLIGRWGRGIKNPETSSEQENRIWL